MLRIPRLLYRAVFRRDSYNVGLVHGPIHRFLDPNWRPAIDWLRPQQRGGTFVADPFGVEVDGRRYLLCEYFDYRERKGRIVGAEITESGEVGSFAHAIGGPCHMSYPFLFVHGGEVLCVPETSRANEVALFRMEGSPLRWRKEKVLLAVDAVDTSIVQHGEHWWLFYGRRRAGSGELYISHARSPRGPWLPHGKQPAKTDLASSRPGGTPFAHAGRLYRPAQDCSRTYGKRVVINEVVTLSPTEFEERAVAVVEADANGPYPDGLHTLSALGDLTLVDGRREKFIWPAVVSSARGVLERMVALARRANRGSALVGDGDR